MMLRSTVRASAILLCLVFAMACDPVDTFVVTNTFNVPLVIEVTVIDSQGRLLDPNTYRVEPEVSIDTAETESVEGYKGGELFSDGDNLLVCAYDETSLVYSREFTYEEVKSMKHHVVVAGDGSSVEAASRCEEARS